MMAASVMLAACAVPALASQAQVGEMAPAFTLTDIHGNAHSLSDFAGKTVVLEWVNPECPFVKKHYSSGNIPALQKSAADSGVVWLAINSGKPGAQGDFDAAEAASWMSDHEAKPTAYFRDQDGAVGRLYGAKTTPHMYVINPTGELVYNGAIDSIPSARKGDLARAENYVIAALAAVKSGEPVERSQTQPYGCGVKY